MFRAFFSYSNEVVRTVLLAAGIHYEPATRGYVLAADPESVARVQVACGQLQVVMLVAAPAVPATPPLLPAPQQELLVRYCQLLALKGYSPGTRKNYRTAFALFLSHHAPRLPLQLARPEIQEYLSGRVAAGISHAYHNLLLNVLKLYYAQAEGLPDWQARLPRPQRPQLVPKLLAQAEVKALLQGTANLKHRVMLMLAYGTGLRLSEILALTLADIDGPRLLVRVCGGERRKPRTVPLPALLLGLVQEQWRQWRPLHFLFEGTHPGQPYSARSLQQVVRQAAARAGIGRPVTLHMLRHSYAAHLVEGGTDLNLLRDLLGHASSKTTRLYARAVRRPQVASPLDNLGLVGA